MTTKLGKIAVFSLAGAAGTALTVNLLLGKPTKRWPTVTAETICIKPKRVLPTRAEHIESLKKCSFDVLVIGGGATGAGCALDSTTRGLKTALIEADDFSSGTSSRSTKMIHGGVRYLQAAIMKLDREQYNMVKEALRERAGMLQQAPHLARVLPILLPVYTWWQIPYFWIGIKMYDVVAGSQTLKSSYYLSKNNTLELFPMLKCDSLQGGIVYYDGMQDDARMNLAIVLTAARLGASVVNHVKVTDITKEDGIICGVKCQDEITGQSWTVSAKCVINATGPFTDNIRKMDDPRAKKICSPSSGVHVILPGYYCAEQMGLLDPATSDGRVIFFLPWQRHTIVGTTDLPCQVTTSPKPTEEEIKFILKEVQHYLNPGIEVRREDVLSAWSGIRPLVSDPNKPDTQSLARNHIIHVSDSHLITIAGGKWTTYRAMAEETIDAAIRACDLQPERPRSQTHGLLLEGANKWSPNLYIKLIQDFGLECEAAQHLVQAYGDRAFEVAELAKLTGKRWPVLGKKIHEEFPYIEAEIRYGCKEYALTAIDMIARRIRLAFLNTQAAQEALPLIVDIMAEELDWTENEKQQQTKLANEFLDEQMGESINRNTRKAFPVNLSKKEIETCVERFQCIDKARKGYVSINDATKSLQSLDINVTDEEIHQLLSTINSAHNGRLEIEDYLRIIAAIKSGPTMTFESNADKSEKMKHEEFLRKRISVERSCGGL